MTEQGASMNTPAAGGAMSTEPSAPSATLQKLVDEQAEDEGLWFIARTAPEAYLQQELRRLHEAIEAAQPSAPSAERGLDKKALELGRRLLARGYEDFHVVTFSDTGYGLQHPIDCRPDLIGCMFNEWLASQLAPDREAGRYRMEWSEEGPTYAALHQPSQPEGEP